jgi:hypothetical protein
MKDMGDAVILTKEEYNYLVKRDEKLEALESYGVDNWCGYGEAMMSLEEE